MNEELVKSLTSLIDETIAEIEDLKKSRFAASEIKLAGPGEDGLKGHSANGKLDKEEDGEDKKDDDKDDDKKDDKDKKKLFGKKEDESKEDDKDDKEDEANKAEGQNRQADPNGGHHKAPVEGMKDGQGPSKSPSQSGPSSSPAGSNRPADPNGGHHAAGGEMGKGDGYPVALKSMEESNSLMKSYIDSKVAPLETKLAGILDLVKRIADQPVAAKGATTKNFAVLHKSDSEGSKSLSKSQVANKLFELKKSGKFVDSADITAAELGSSELQAI